MIGTNNGLSAHYRVFDCCLICGALVFQSLVGPSPNGRRTRERTKGTGT